MGKHYFGEFEEVVLLTVGVLEENAYGVTIKDEIEQRTGKKASIGALHSALNRLEKKGYLQSSEGGATTERGGRRKRYFRVTAYGKRALIQSKDLRSELWSLLPEWSVKFKT
ncbi:PadR family transcriptional regulator [Catalinimonas niigatensis]|uniref:PadR family transcriptional regulator n=1 Tax=Catalinimonas niigatensis TaxID=1397264 RepID=UPI002666E64D|nr:helix-turn-helix transcriptional regulator [Catalinimonas niigatensis]WPP51970.1 helix-turn-helix transcriptional regulator [Catalinimonas niigatensis]